MAEVTRVPLQPVKKGTLPKIWLGVLVVLAAAVLMAWINVPHFQKLDNGVQMETLKEGRGLNPGMTDYVLVNYKGMLADGKVFDEGEGVPFKVSGVVPGFTTALQSMQMGGEYRVMIPADQGYGDEEKSDPMTGNVVIPANSDLTFEVTLIDFRSEAEVMQQMQQQQMMQQMMGGQPGAPGAPPAGQ